MVRRRMERSPSGGEGDEAGTGECEVRVKRTCPDVASTSSATPQTSSALALTERDDVAERQQRRQLALLERQLTDYSSPVVDPSQSRRRRSVNPNGWSNAQITDHYATCIKLCTQNKISIKNAFSLHLIDYLSELLKSKQGELTNFQMAGSSLDASAKIYSYRVDCVHQQTCQVAGGLGKSEMPGKGVPTSDGDDGANMDAEEDRSSRPKKRRANRSKKIEEVPKTINIQKLEMEMQIDPLFQKACTQFQDATSGHLLSASISASDDKCRLQLHSYELPDEASSGDVCSEDLQDIVAELESMFSPGPRSLCPSLIALSEKLDESECALMEVMDAMDEDDDVAVPDLSDASSGGGHIPDDGDADLDLSGFNVGCAAAPREPEEIVEKDQEHEPLTEIKRFPTVEAIRQAMSAKPLEYNYFSSQGVDIWGGPEHWRLKLRKPGELQREVAKVKRKRRKNADSFVSFNREIKDATLEKAMKKFLKNILDHHGFDSSFLNTTKLPRRLATMLGSKTLEKYTKEATTLDDLINYLPERLGMLMSRHNVKVQHLQNETNDVHPLVAMDDTIPDFRFHAPPGQMSPFSANLNADDDADEDQDAGFGGDDWNDSFADNRPSPPPGPSGELFEVEMVPEPVQVQSLNIQYAKQAKKIDVRRLKRVMWRLLTKESRRNQLASVDTDTTVTGEVGYQMTVEKKFSKLCSDLLRHVPPSTAQNLSVPIIFVCLLHLCNEKMLQLEQVPGMKDLLIRPA